MKKLAIQLLFASIMIVGINFMSSCDGCSRKETTTEVTTETDMNDSASSDTLNYDNSGNSTGSQYGSGGTSTDRNSGSSNSTGTSGATTTNGTPAGGTNSSAKTNTVDPNNDPIENSNYNKNKKDGVISGGSAGSGSGTGTGSTGNNSRVRTVEDQKN